MNSFHVNKMQARGVPRFALKSSILRLILLCLAHLVPLATPKVLQRSGQPMEWEGKKEIGARHGACKGANI